MNIQFREASFADWKGIADIHILSWQENYRGIFTDDFLDHDIYKNRKEIWHDRFQNPPNNQFVLIAEVEEFLVGFACTYCHYKEEKIHYLDNLHVRSQLRGKRIGENLLSQSALHAFQKDPLSPFYLLVFEENESAIRFYKRMGALVSDPFEHVNEDGTRSKVARCTWPSLNAFSN